MSTTRIPTVSHSQSVTAPPSSGSVAGTTADSSAAATTRSCAPASAADSRCNPGRGDASPRPTAPLARRTSNMYPTRVVPARARFVSSVSSGSGSITGSTKVVGSRSIGRAKRDTVEETTAFGCAVPVGSASSASASASFSNLFSSASAASTASATRLCSSLCCARFLAREVVTSTTECLPSAHAARSAVRSAAGVLGCACATRCASQRPLLETSGGVAKSFVNFGASI